jgi:hypothetical protein
MHMRSMYAARAPVMYAALMRRRSSSALATWRDKRRGTTSACAQGQQPRYAALLVFAFRVQGVGGQIAVMVGQHTPLYTSSGVCRVGMTHAPPPHHTTPHHTTQHHNRPRHNTTPHNTTTGRASNTTPHNTTTGRATTPHHTTPHLQWECHSLEPCTQPQCWQSLLLTQLLRAYVHQQCSCLPRQQC